MDWRTLMAGFGACVDMPWCMHWHDIAAAHPDALILLTVREPESWFASWCVLMQFNRRYLAPLAALRIPPFTAALPVIRAIVHRFFGPHAWHPERDKAGHIARFQAHYDSVREAVPKGRLLELRVSADAWAPLVAFLNSHGIACTIPDDPFPHVNERSSMGMSKIVLAAWLHRQQIGVVLCILLAPLCAALLALVAGMASMARVKAVK